MAANDMSNLDEIFEPGPVGFLDDSAGQSRLRRFVCAVNPELPIEPSKASVKPQSETPPEDDEEDEEGEDDEGDEELQGADAWRADAMRRWRGLWTGDVGTIEAVFGVDAPHQLVAFSRATDSANPWSTFEELRLDAALMGLPGEGENLFEKCILNDQLNYLGTALPEVFSGLICIGTLGNGDSYHLELSPSEGDSRAVYYFNHETHRYEWAFSVDLESLAYLTALCHAADGERVSAEIAAAGFEALHGKVAPSWHFSMDKRAEGFVQWEPEGALPIFLFWRSRWIHHLFRQDGIVQLDDLRESFVEQLNTVLAPEHLPGRLEIAARSAPTALYAVWRAYLFGEEELAQYMEICRRHPARLVRDAVELVDELREGRQSIGRIQDWPKLLERFRELDLDPRRAAAREAEAQARQAAIEEERQTLRQELAGLEGEAEVAFVAERVSRPELHGAMLHTMLARPSRAKAKRGLEYLFRQEYSRDGSLYRHEEHEACAYVAANADPALLLVLLGAGLHPAGGDEDNPLPAPGDCWLIARRACSKLPEAGRHALLDELSGLELEEHPGWRETALVSMVGDIGERDAAPVLQALLGRLPSEGGFETALHYDDFVGAIAIALRQIGEPSAMKALAPFATSGALRMRDARVESALAIAAIAPDLFTDAMADRAVEFVSQINDRDENAKALLSIAKARPEHAGAKDAKPMASRHPEVRFAQALIASDEQQAKSELHDIFTAWAYDQKGTIARRRFGLLIHELFEMAPDADVLQQACGLDAALDEDLARLGGFEPPRRLRFFDAEQMSAEQLRKALQDASIRGRAHAARCARGDDSARAALEAAIDSVLESDIEDDTRYLLKEAVMSLVALDEAESTVMLFDKLLRHGSRDIKDPVLRQAPPWKGLKGAMEHVRDEKWGWQERAATQWLEAH